MASDNFMAWPGSMRSKEIFRFCQNVNFGFQSSSELSDSLNRFASGTMGDKLKNLQFGQSVDLSGLMIAEKRRG